MGKIAKDKRDIYYRLAKQQGYRSRSSFKLIQIEELFKIISQSNYIVDLCAAPGGWTQIAHKFQMNNSSKIISVDLQKMSPFDDVIIITGDITHQETINKIFEETGKQCVDLVLCDGAPDVIKFVEFDVYIQSQLILSALNIAIRILNKGGKFVCKIFRGSSTVKIVKIMKRFFSSVNIAKPKACRNASFEAFLVCEGFKLKEEYQFLKENEMHNQKDVLFLNSVSEEVEMRYEEIHFVQVGSHEYDSDKTYDLQATNYEKILDPVTKPINPPYKYYIDNFKGISK
jgi:tRNA (cytidine32/guanosine34-2'-O)-methyltransferase